LSQLAVCVTAAQAILHHLAAYEAGERAAAATRSRWLVALEPTALLTTLTALRRELCQALVAFNEAEQGELATHDAVFRACEQLRGNLFDQLLLADEVLLLTSQEKCLHTNGARSFCAFVVLSFYRQPFHLPLPTSMTHLNRQERLRTLELALRQPHLMTEADDTLYVAHYIRLTDWARSLIEDEAVAQEEKAEYLAIIKNRLTFGACYYVDCSTIALLKSRAQLIAALKQSIPALRTLAQREPPPRQAGGKIKLGILSRNRADYTDTRALFALFHAFDPTLYEIYWYSLDILDATSLQTESFTQELNDFTHQATVLQGDAAQMAQTIMADDLDIFVLGTAYGFGVKELDLALSLRLARVQVSLAALIAGSTALPNFDYYVVPVVDAATTELFRAESTEQLKFLAGPLLWYQEKDKVLPAPELTRASLGIPADATLYISAAAANKQMAGTLRTWMTVLQNVPNSILLFFPFNPAWGGYYIALTFLARLRSVLRDFPDITPDRIRIIREMSPDEADRILQLGDIALGSFPRDGGTMAMLSLRYGLPLVARKESWLHTPNDALMLRSLGLDALIGANNAEVAAIASRLGRDKIERQEIAQTIAATIDHAPFFDIATRSKALQKIFDEMVASSKNIAS